MKLEKITEGLRNLLLENHYNPTTIHFYERGWNKLQIFLMDEYGDTAYDIEHGLRYLEKQYNFISKYNDGTLSQQRVQLLRVVHMLEDYSLHKVLTRRYYASKNPLVLNDYYSALFDTYSEGLETPDLSASTVGHYRSIATVFMDYLTQLKISYVDEISMDICNNYLKTLAGYSFKTVEQNVCGVRSFLRFLYYSGTIVNNYAEKIHMPRISKSAGIPSAWQIDDLKAMIAAIDRNSPIGKSDYPCMCAWTADWRHKESSLQQLQLGREKTFYCPA